MQNNTTIYPVILAGGAGTRLWPLSQVHHPKQFLKLVGSESLFQQTYNRIKNIEGFLPPLVVCNKESAPLISHMVNKESLSVIVEPTSCNTAIAVAVSTLYTFKFSNDPLLLILPSDHFISNDDEFIDKIKRATKLADKKIIIFGIEPTKVKTGYGYIELDGSAREGYFGIKKFTEKPNYQKAKEYVESKNYFWNSGIILTSGKVLLEEMQKYCPEIIEIAHNCVSTLKTEGIFSSIDSNGYEKCPSEPIDTSLLEKTKNILVYPLGKVDWNDLGTWSALWDINRKDQNGNIIYGRAIYKNVKNSYLYSNGRTIAVTNMEDCIVVETPDVVFITKRDSEENIKDIFSAYHRTNSASTENDKVVIKPWGSYEILTEGEGHKVKRIIVNPSQSLSLQVHQKRDEHWVVVRGTATVTKGEELFELSPNQHIFITKGVKHRIKNCTNDIIELIEVQTGAYLGEDDIIRLSDQYDRVTLSTKYV
ncbi:MAG: mannose-1-phosphate guanylyltransferase/mannose-6-phosphate isomerase [Alphaproteobacteria bacterium]|nr:mannose-1-phosphate guanylyltransferase/mannose-6-phosphate isomerase [Alphaproteobacteria bacterium]